MRRSPALSYPSPQGVIHSAWEMDTAPTAAAKAVAQETGRKYLEVFHTDLPANDQALLVALFAAANAPTGDFHFCAASTILARNMPSASMHVYHNENAPARVTRPGGGSGRLMPRARPPRHRLVRSLPHALSCPSGHPRSQGGGRAHDRRRPRLAQGDDINVYIYMRVNTFDVGSRKVQGLGLGLG